MSTFCHIDIEIKRNIYPSLWNEKRGPIFSCNILDFLAWGILLKSWVVKLILTRKNLRVWLVQCLRFPSSTESCLRCLEVHFWTFYWESQSQNEKFHRKWGEEQCQCQIEKFVESDSLQKITLHSSTMVLKVWDKASRFCSLPLSCEVGGLESICQTAT